MILVDTAPLVAIVDPRDSLHSTALKDLAALSRAGFCVCEAVLMEACFHLPHRTQRERLRAALDEFNIDSLPTGDTVFWNDVFAWLVRYADHEPDWADGCIAVLCARDKRFKVWTYDREFRTIWRRPDGKAIPLAIK